MFAITETWLADSDSAVISKFLPSTHRFFHVQRTTGRGGGVGAVVRKNLKSVKSISRSKETFECLELHLIHNNKKILINILYRPPHHNVRDFLHDFEALLMENVSVGCDVMYIGDFNIWVDDPDNSDANNFNEILETYNLRNFVTKPTYGSGHTLDLIITGKDDRMIESINVEEAPTFSDHMLVTFEIKSLVSYKKEKTIFFRRKNDLMSSMLINELKPNMDSSKVECEHSVSTPCAECVTELFRSCCQRVYNEACPIITKTKRVRDEGCGFYNPEIHEAKKNMRRTEKLYIRSKSEYHFNEFKRLRHIKCKLVTKHKKIYCTDKITSCSSDSKMLSNLLNNLLGKNDTSSILPPFKSKTELANNLKNYFLEKIENIVSSFPISDNKMCLIPDFPLKKLNHFSPVTPENIGKIISSMKKTHCKNDPVDIRNVNLAEDESYLQQIYNEIVNISFETGIFPETEKFSYISPLVKQGKDPDELSSYRPLYKTSFLSKVLEKCALEQLSKHIMNFSCIPVFQSAYKEFFSVETALCRVYNDLVKSISKGECSILIMLDQSAAFDSLNQAYLLKDLEQLGIADSALNWIRSYITGRRFRVSIDDKESDEGVMKYGVPQGTCLGPVLYIIYTLSLQYVLEEFNVQYHMYADDLQIYFRITGDDSDVLVLDEVSRRVQTWMVSRKLKLNPEKTEIMVIGSRHHLSNLELSNSLSFLNSNVSFSNKLRNLGVIFDPNLTMKNQINHTKRKAIANLKNIATISEFIDHNSRIKLIHGLVLSHLDFCNSLYHNLPACTLHPLQMVLNSAARIIAQIPRFSYQSITPVCINLHFLPIKARIEYKICLLTYKAIKSGQPPYLAELLKTREVHTDMQLRSIQESTLDEPFLSRSVTINRCFEYSAPRLYNSLPHNVTSQSSVHSFKNKLKTYLFQKAYNLENQSLNPSYRV